MIGAERKPALDGGVRLRIQSFRHRGPLAEPGSQVTRIALERVVRREEEWCHLSQDTPGILSCALVAEGTS